MDVLQFGEEQLNRRARYLRVLGRLWTVPTASGLSALLFFLVYFLATSVFSGAREYRYESKLYLDYAMNEGTQTAYDYYNGWTWNDLLSSEPALSDAILAALPEGCGPETVREEVHAAILSDIRIMTVTVTDHSPERAALIGEAVNQALTHFGDTAREFDQIRLMSSTGPSLVTWSNRTKNAILLGAVLGALAGIALLLLKETLNEAVYVPEEAERRYGLPVLGVLRVRPGQKRTESEERELTANLARFALHCRVDARADARADAPADALREDALQAAPSPAAVREAAEDRGARGAVAADGTDAPALTAVSLLDLSLEPGQQIEGMRVVDPADYESLRRAPGVVLAVRYGAQDGPAVLRLLSVLRQQDCPAGALVLDRADERFLKKYQVV